LGEWKDGEKILSENELCKKFKVSRQTVRVALKNLEIDGFIRRIRGSGTFISNNHRKIEYTGTVGIIVQNLNSYIFPMITLGAEKELSKNGYNILLGNANENPQKEAQIIKRWFLEGVNGMIVDPVYSATDQCNKNLIREISKTIPVVVINSDIEVNSAGNLILNDYECGQKAAAEFLKNNHKKLAVLYKAIHEPAQKRKDGFVDYLRREKIGFIIEQPFYEPEESGIAVKLSNSILSLPVRQRPTGIFCINDSIALQTEMAMRKIGLRIPENLSLISFDDSTFASLLNFSTFVHPKEEFGKKAVKMLLRMMIGRKPEKEKINIKFINRCSLKKL